MTNARSVADRPADGGVGPFAEALARRFGRLERGARHRVAIATLLVLGVASTAYWALGSTVASFGSPVEAKLTPLVAAVAVVGAGVVLRWPRSLRGVAPTLLVGLLLAAGMDAREALRLGHDAGDVRGALFALSTWLPAVYVWSFIALGSGWALVVNGLLLTSVVALAAAHVGLGRPVAHVGDEAEAVLQLVAAGTLYNAVVFWMVRLYRGLALRIRRSAQEAVHRIDPHTGLDTLNGLRVPDELTDEPGPVAVVSVVLRDAATLQGRFGHGAVHRLLQRAAARIHAEFPSVGPVARLAEHELAFAVTAVPTPQGAAELGQRVATAVHRPFELDGQRVSLLVAVGVAHSADGREDLVELARRASEASEHARAARVGAVEVYRPSLSDANARRVTVRGCLESARIGNEFELHYQPVLDLAEGRVSGFEALLRWRSPVLGWVSPAEFVPAAEDTGRIHELGAWVLRRALAQLERWHRVRADLRVSVNVSPVEFLHEDYLNAVKSVLEAHPGAARRLVVEITEGVVMHGNEHVRQRLGALRALGPIVAVDDFGTGFSSLGYLRKLPVQILKVDRAFVKDLPTRDGAAERLLRGVIELGHALGLRVVAEGVETPEQLRLLQSAGCDAMQGYLASRPVPAPLVAELLHMRLDDLLNASEDATAGRASSVAAGPGRA